MKTSVIIATYNRPEALSLVVQSLLNQTEPPTEIIIADDGSTAETKTLVQNLQQTSRIPIIHAWQEDRGFQVAKVRNLAVSKSCQEFLIFLDGDCLPMSTFIANYKKLAQKRWFCTGSRISLREELSTAITQKQINIHQWVWHKWLIERLKGQVKRLLPFVSLPAKAQWRYKNSDNWQSLRSCNMACFYEDYLQVNGFDESFVGWGREDSDLAIRFINGGIKRKDARYSVPVIHLWHQENDRSSLDKNTQILNEVIISKKVLADIGVKQYL